MKKESNTGMSIISALIRYPNRLKVVKLLKQKIKSAFDEQERRLARYSLYQYLMDEYRHGHLLLKDQKNLLLPSLDILMSIGAHQRLHEELANLKHLESEPHYQILMTMDMVNHYDFAGMKVWLKRAEAQSERLTNEERMQTYVNLMHVAYNQKWRSEMEAYVPQMERLVYDKHMMTPEALDDLMQIYERRNSDKEIERLIKLINGHKEKNWKNYLEQQDVIYRHYQRTEQLDKRRQVVKELGEQAMTFGLTEEQKNYFEIKYLRLLFDSQISAWENYSINLYNNREKYLMHSPKMAFEFIQEYLFVYQGGIDIYNRVLKDEIALAVENDIAKVMPGYVKEIDEKVSKMPSDFLYERCYALQQHMELARLMEVEDKKNIAKWKEARCEAQRQKIRACKEAGNIREHLHWLLCYADDLMAQDSFLDNLGIVKENELKESLMAQRTVYRRELEMLTEELDGIVKRLDYNPSVAYYLIHLANIHHCLGHIEKAHDMLALYDRTGDDPHVYAVTVRRIYRRLEMIYQTRNLTADEKLEERTRYLAELNGRREIKEALIIVDSQMKEMPIDGKQLPEGLCVETLMEFILQSMTVWLNGNRIADVIRMSALFDSYAKDYIVPISVRTGKAQVTALALRRKGLKENALKVVDEVLSGKDVPDDCKVKLLMLRGGIESDMAWPEFKINSQLEAMEIAERMGDGNIIAKVYGELVSLFQNGYPALSLSLMKKEELWYEKTRNVYELECIKLKRAQAYLNLHILYHAHYQERTAPFFAACMRILESIDVVTLRDSDRAFYNRLMGIATMDTNYLWNSLAFYRNVNGRSEAYRVAETIYIIASKKGDKDEALRGVNEYLAMAEEDGDKQRITVAKINMNGIKAGYKLDFAPPSIPAGPRTLLTILDAISFDEEQWMIAQKGFFPIQQSPEEEGKFRPVDMGDGTAALAPLGLLPGHYYRGQAERFMPCLPSLYRPKMKEADVYLERVKYEEFKLLVDSHPITDKYVSGAEIDGQPLHFHIYHLALAQHYGIATELMDMTTSKWVAAFFAVTDYKGDDIYEVHKDDGKSGVFYVYAPNPLFSSVGDRCVPIGIQPFSRPGEQMGYVIGMEKGEDLEKIVQTIEFQHDDNVSELIFNLANRSKRLFPDDILKTKADIIKNSKSFSETAYRLAKEEFYPNTDATVIEVWERNTGMKHQDEAVARFTAEDMKRFHDEYPEFDKKLRMSLWF